MELILEEAHQSEPRFIGSFGPCELWKVGRVAFVIPALLDDYPPGVKDAIDRRRRASLSGRCECGARRQIGHGRLLFEHESVCDASNVAIARLAAQHGLELQLFVLERGQP